LKEDYDVDTYVLGVNEKFDFIEFFLNQNDKVFFFDHKQEYLRFFTFFPLILKEYTHDYTA